MRRLTLAWPLYRTLGVAALDHVPFQQAGIPCFLAIELDDVDYPGYHRTTDTVSYMNYDQALDILKGLAATMCALASTA